LSIIFVMFPELVTIWIKQVYVYKKIIGCYPFENHKAQV